MIAARPTTEYLRYANQDCDELQGLLCDLQAHPGDYLSHGDGFVRSLADWTMEYYKLRNLRGDVPRDVFLGRQSLCKLYARLQVLATPD